MIKYDYAREVFLRVHFEAFRSEKRIVMSTVYLLMNLFKYIYSATYVGKNFNNILNLGIVDT